MHMFTEQGDWEGTEGMLRRLGKHADEGKERGMDGRVQERRGNRAV